MSDAARDAGDTAHFGEFAAFDEVDILMQMECLSCILERVKNHNQMILIRFKKAGLKCCRSKC